MKRKEQVDDNVITFTMECSNAETGFVAIATRYDGATKVGCSARYYVRITSQVPTFHDRPIGISLPPEFAEDNERMNRFVREAKSASALNHPNINTIHGIGETHTSHFSATEFIDESDAVGTDAQLINSTNRRRAYVRSDICGTDI